MKAIIEGFRVPNNPSAFLGLNEASVKRLPEMAVFAGPNGGGKSRLLRLIAEHGPNQGRRQSLREQLESLRQNKESLRQNKESLRQNKENAIAQVRRGQPPHPVLPNFESQFSSIERELARIESDLVSILEIQTEISAGTTYVYFAPVIGAFNDPGGLTFSQATSLLGQGGNIRGISGNFSSSLLTIQSLVTNYLISRAEESEFSIDNAAI
jgi:hypothetical protein